jgi:hypothetical protein
VVVLVNDSVCCGANIGRQFPLTADIRAMVVVFVDVDLRVRTVGNGGRRKKGQFEPIFTLIAGLKAQRTSIVVTS